MKKLTFVDFCLRVLKLKLTRAQRILVAIGIDGVQPNQFHGDERAIAHELFGDVDTIASAARRTQVWSLGRGSGKTTICAALMIFVAVTADLSRVGPGMTPAAVAIAPRAGTAKIVIDVARTLVRNVPSLERMVADDADAKEGFSLVRDGRRVRLAAFAASRAGVNLRGYDILTLILDEAELFASGTEYVVTDRDSYNAGLPRLMHGDGHHAILISTPWPVPTLMGELFEKNFGDPATALASRGSTLTMRDHDATLAAEIALERQNDPENTARERDCDRDASGSSSFFDAARVDWSVDSSIVLPFVLTPGDKQIEVVAAGGDLGLISDSSANAIVSLHPPSGLTIVRSLREMRPVKGTPLKLSEVVATFCDDLDLFGIKSITLDGHAREPAREWTDKRGVKIVNAPSGSADKLASFVHTRKTLNEGLLRLPNAPRLIAQMKATIAKATAGGNTQIIQPRRAGLAHGDLCAALVLACTASKTASRAALRRTAVSSMPLPAKVRFEDRTFGSYGGAIVNGAQRGDAHATGQGHELADWLRRTGQI
jgi:hypothetical protein